MGGRRVFVGYSVLINFKIRQGKISAIHRLSSFAGSVMAGEVTSRFLFIPPVPRIFYKIALKTAPADFRFPTTNQTRHCFTRYIEFHRCLAAKGESNECERFAKYYRSLCPGEWVERWNEQRKNGIFPGPL
ncbi:cytochrome c oxidase subunit 6b-2 isoform X1 [Gossypium hirsutum]|uniref:Cytochrome c oxidase subunit 6b-2 isoform X1 n=1 Tax=Gossypium hirsutum TaxID=3635 RepID=A0ABM3BU66_GOSHI|nr:cytochrome c oxidase subunit 6b-2-like isoform X1 [Gossypium hirsutum]